MEAVSLSVFGGGVGCLYVDYEENFIEVEICEYHFYVTMMCH